MLVNFNTYNIHRLFSRSYYGKLKMVLIIEQVLRWAILVFTLLGAIGLTRSYFTQQERPMDMWQQEIRFWYLVGFVGLFLHAVLMLWTQFERTGKVFLWN